MIRLPTGANGSTSVPFTIFTSVLRLTTIARGAQVLALEVVQRVGEEDVVVQIGRQLGRPLADAAKRQGACVMAGGLQALDHERPGLGAHPGPGQADEGAQSA